MAYLLRCVKPFSYNQFLDFLYSLRDSGYKANYLNKLIITARLWGHFTKDKKLLTLKLDRRNTATVKSILSLDQVKSIITCPVLKKQHAKQHERYSLLFHLLASTGCRPHEIAHITIDRISWGQNAFLLGGSDTKTHDERIVPIPESCKNQLKKLYDERVREGKTLLFCTEGGKKLRNQDWNDALYNRMKFLGIPKIPGLSVKSLRDQYIVEMLQTPGVNLFDVKKLVGHKNTETTEIYYKYTTRRLQEVAKMFPLEITSIPVQERLKQLASIMRVSIGANTDLELYEELKEGELVLRIVRKP